MGNIISDHGFPKNHSKECVCHGYGTVCEAHENICWGFYCNSDDCKGCCGGAGVPCKIDIL